MRSKKNRVWFCGFAALAVSSAVFLTVGNRGRPVNAKTALANPPATAVALILTNMKRSFQ